MEIQVQKEELENFKCDALIINLFQGVTNPSGGTGAVDEALEGLISKIIKEDKFEGKEGQIFSFRTLGKLRAKHVIVVGLGNKKDFSTESIRRAMALSIKKAKELGARTIGSIVPGAGIGDIVPRQAAQAMVEGAMLANYSYSKFKKDNAKKEAQQGIKTFVLVENDARKIKGLEQGVENGMITSLGTIFARDLVNEPSLHMTPAELVEKARQIAKNSKGKIKLKVYDKAGLEKMKAGGILGVAMGSDHPPYMVHLIWKPANAKKKIALVGKAITFDSGGLSLKPSNVMETMKLDMAGAASVLGAFSVLTKIKPVAEIHGIFAACENMPSGKAYRPGDILETSSGKTIEVLNTDAEGRITLADSLYYATKLKPDFIIDLATLTGACMVGLGDYYAGIMGNNNKLIDKIIDAGSKTGEVLWKLPLPKEYHQLIESKFADVKNIGGKYGGALTAGLFLQEFIGETPWVHIDLAGPSFSETEYVPYIPPGGTGFGVRTLLEFIKNV